MTPIFIDFTKTPSGLYQTSSYLDLDTKDPVDLYTEDTDPVTSTQPQILAPRYYVLIHSPANRYSATKKINIEKAPHSINRNQLRVELQPSIGYGLNACYKVDYWKWQPLLNLTADITNTKIHTEYWYVPNIDYLGFYVSNYYMNDTPRSWPYGIAQWNVATRKYPYLYWPYYYNRKVTKEFTADRIIQGDYVYDTITSREALSIIRLQDDKESFTILSQPNTFSYNAEAATWTYSKDVYGVRLKRLISGVNGLEGQTPTQGDNQTIKVAYYLPFHPCDIVVQEEYSEQYI